MKEKFKTFETLERLLKRYSMLVEADEADNTDDQNQGEEAAEPEEDAADEGGDMPEELTDGEAPQTEEVPMQPQGAMGDNPDAQADVDNGIFISDNKKAEFAKMMLDALMSNPPKTGEIPQQYLNVTIDNSDDVINFIQSLLALGSGIGDDGEESLSEELKGV